MILVIMAGPLLKFPGVIEKDWKIYLNECRRSLKVDLSGRIFIFNNKPNY